MKALTVKLPGILFYKKVNCQLTFGSFCKISGERFLIRIHLQ